MRQLIFHTCQSKVARRGGGARKATVLSQARVCKSQGGTVLLLGCGNGRASWHRKQLFRVVWSGVGNCSTEQRVCSCICSLVLCYSAPQLPAHLCTPHTFPPYRERSVENRKGLGASKHRKRGHKSSTCTPPPSPTDLYVVSRGDIYVPTLPTTNTQLLTLSGAPQ